MNKPTTPPPGASPTSRFSGSSGLHLHRDLINFFPEINRYTLFDQPIPTPKENQTMYLPIHSDLQVFHTASGADVPSVSLTSGSRANLTDLNRADINRLIAALREARDIAYGADQ